MPDVQRDPAIRGKTIQLKWTEGPTKDSTHEHVFHEDGTVEWHDPQSKGGPAKERPAYAAIRVLTVVLNFRDHTMAGFASSAKDWHPLRGNFEVVR